MDGCNFNSLYVFCIFHNGYALLTVNYYKRKYPSQDLIWLEDEPKTYDKRTLNTAIPHYPH